MSVDDMIIKLAEISNEGYGDNEVYIPSPTGGNYSCDSVELEGEDNFIVLLS